MESVKPEMEADHYESSTALGDQLRVEGQKDILAWGGIFPCSESCYYWRLTFVLGKAFSFRAGQFSCRLCHYLSESIWL